MTPRVPWPRGGRLVLVLGLGAGYAWVAGGLSTFTWPAAVATFVPGLAVLATAWRLQPRRPAARTWWRAFRADRRAHPGQRLAGYAWLTLVLALAVWELLALFGSPRYQHPTISSVEDLRLTSHPARAALYAGWLAFGWELWRR